MATRGVSLLATWPVVVLAAITHPPTPVAAAQVPVRALVVLVTWPVAVWVLVVLVTWPVAQLAVVLATWAVAQLAEWTTVT